jgi:hypothetical protein
VFTAFRQKNAERFPILHVILAQMALPVTEKQQMHSNGSVAIWAELNISTET